MDQESSGFRRKLVSDHYTAEPTWSLAQATLQIVDRKRLQNFSHKFFLPKIGLARFIWFEDFLQVKVSGKQKNFDDKTEGEIDCWKLKSYETE